RTLLGLGVLLWFYSGQSDLDAHWLPPAPILSLSHILNSHNFHGRDQAVPTDTESLARVLPPTAMEIERVGEDVRTLVYVDLDEQIASFFAFVEQLENSAWLMGELGIPTADAELLLKLFSAKTDASAKPVLSEAEGLSTSFRERSVALGIEEWVRILDGLARGYIARRFSGRYRDLLFAIWKLRTLTFCLNEAGSFEEAEENTRKQATYAFQYGQGLTAQPSSVA
ncbi:MAG: hypothetical protein SWK90_10040, partial [Chloroflexota bacterium]|nr:hypothetical protein [Chloroflexota bacterium]